MKRVGPGLCRNDNWDMVRVVGGKVADHRVWEKLIPEVCGKITVKYFLNTTIP